MAMAEDGEATDPTGRFGLQQTSLGWGITLKSSSLGNFK
jgi:hypothetical protein